MLLSVSKYYSASYLSLLLLLLLFLYKPIALTHSLTFPHWQPVSYENASVTGMGAGQQGKFMLLPGQWTDDTSMGLCIADSILSNAGESARIQ